MSFDIKKSIELLSPEYFKESISVNNSTFQISVFNDSKHNFIIPNNNFQQQDVIQNEKIIADFKSKGQEFSYYIPIEINDQLKGIIESTGVKFDCTTRYTFKYINKPYEIAEHEIIKMNEQNFDKFLEAANICFPGWDNISFTKWCLDCPAVEMLAVVIDGEIAAFAGYFSKPENDCVLLMNAATLPKFRRQGLHDYVIKKRINTVLESRQSAIFYADVDDGEASHLGFMKLGFEDGEVFVSYN